MSKTLLVAFMALLLAGSMIFGDDSKDEKKAMKEKLTQQIATMKAEGASQEEIDRYVAEFKKKMAAKNSEFKTSSSEVEALKIEAKKKIAEMKAAGATENEIQDVMAKYKQKIEQIESTPPKPEKKEKKTKEVSKDKKPGI
jgi:hypothetical protein